jgi:septal ring factor EnvC (AmiA/AmiB activator)
MNDYATKKDVQEIVNKAVDNLTELVTTFMHQVDQRFNKIEEEIIDLKASHDRLLHTIDGFLGRIDRYETEQAARDSQFEKLLAWARKVSEKTGIPLENL